MNHLVKFGVMYLATLSFCIAGERGSGGTGGGGNFKSNVSELLPKTLTVKSLMIMCKYDYPERIQKKKCYLLFNCEEYSTHYAYEAYYWQNYAVSRLIAMNPRAHKIIWQQISTKPTEYMSSDLPTARLNYIRGWRELAREGDYEIIWDGSKISLTEFNDRMNKLKLVVWSELDLEDFDSIQNFAKIIQFEMQVVGTYGLNWTTGESLVAGSMFSKLALKIKEAVLNKTKDWEQMAERAIQGDECDHKVYDELISQINTWKVGTRWFFRKIQNIPNSSISFQKQFLFNVEALRASIYENVLLNVMPLCESEKISKRDLYKKLPVLLEEKE